MNLVLFQRVKLTRESVILRDDQVLPGLAPEERLSHVSLYISKYVPFCYTLRYVDLFSVLTKAVNTF